LNESKELNLVGYQNVDNDEDDHGCSFSSDDLETPLTEAGEHRSPVVVKNEPGEEQTNTREKARAKAESKGKGKEKGKGKNDPTKLLAVLEAAVKEHHEAALYVQQTVCGRSKPFIHMRCRSYYSVSHALGHAGAGTSAAESGTSNSKVSI
jgi:hypothetical protein